MQIIEEGRMRVERMGALCICKSRCIVAITHQTLEPWGESAKEASEILCMMKPFVASFEV